jgi:hypothetical protein
LNGASQGTINRITVADKNYFNKYLNPHGNISVQQSFLVGGKNTDCKLNPLNLPAPFQAFKTKAKTGCTH